MNHALKQLYWAKCVLDQISETGILIGKRFFSIDADFCPWRKYRGKQFQRLYHIIMF